MICWTSSRQYVTAVYDCRMTHWLFCLLKVGMFSFFGSCQSPRWPHLPFVHREYVSAFVYCSLPDCPSTDAATSTQITMAILIRSCYCSVLWYLYFCIFMCHFTHCLTTFTSLATICGLFLAVLLVWLYIIMYHDIIPKNMRWSDMGQSVHF